jgi:hypothetical protein
MAAIFTDEESPLFHTSDYPQIKRMIDEDDEIKKATETTKNSLSFVATQYLLTSGIEDIIEITNGLTSVFLTVFTALGTYYEDGTPMIIQIIELILLISMMINYVLNLIIAENRLIYFFSFQAGIDYITIIPFFLVRINVI